MARATTTTEGKAPARTTKSAAPAKAASGDKTLTDLLSHGLKDMYYAEKKIHKALPKMIKAAQDAGLKESLTAHREETAGQITSLESCFAALGMKPKAEKCDAIDGILTEGESLLEDFGGTPAGDAAIIFSAQAVEHYEIARYGSLATYAALLGHDDVKEMLGSILAQEEAADAKLSQAAEGGINATAAQGA